MKISVIVPVYNVESYLPACLDSILHQTYHNLEIILINDGSKDDSGRICNQYATVDARIRVIHQENHGVSHARNQGLQLATGVLISFVDSDDILEKDMYAFLVEQMIQCDADIAHCGYKRMDEQGTLIREITGSHDVLVQTGSEAIACMLKGLYFSVGLWNKLFKHSLVADLRFCEELKNNEDVLFNVQAFARADRTVFADETKYRYYEHPTSACNQLGEMKKFSDSIKASEKMLVCVKDTQAEDAVNMRIFESRLNLYRYCLSKPGLTVSTNIKDEKEKLRKAYCALSHPPLRCKINYCLLIYVPMIYKFVYKAYDLLRKPNWDAESGK